jgi:hypothetical protein
MNRHFCAVLLAASLLAACSAIKTYPNTLPRNLHIRTETSSGSVFSKVRAAVHIHQVDAICRTDYQGMLELDQPSLEVGIPAERLTLMAFVFTSTATLGGSSSSIRVEALLKPRAGYSYDAKVSYVDSIYDVVIREIDPRKSSSRQIERKTWKSCTASAS